MSNRRVLPSRFEVSSLSTLTIRLTSSYPASTGRINAKVLRVVDSLQTGDKKKVTSYFRPSIYVAHLAAASQVQIDNFS